MHTSPLHILILLGSIRNGRYTDKVARYLSGLLSQKDGVSPQIWDLAEDPLPLLAQQWKKEKEPSPIFQQKSKLLQEADGIILCSPEYHGSYSGVLKNALDHFWKEFERKPMGVVSTGSGPMGGINGSTEMQLLILSLGAYPMPRKLLTPYVQKLFDEKDAPQESSFVENAHTFVDEYLWFVDALKS